MKKPRKNDLWQTAAFLLCILVPLLGNFLENLEASEFSGGGITGPLISMFNYGLLLFILALFFTFFYPRAAATIGFVACLICFPLYFYFVFPGAFRSVFKGNYSVPLQEAFVWDILPVTGLLTLAAGAFACVHRLWAGRGKTALARNV